MKFKRFVLSVMAFSLAVSLCACGGSDDGKKEKPSSEVEVEDVNEEKEPEKIVYKSKLTGLPVESEEDSYRRPVAIMINNIKKALPQSGISKASIIYEALAEGGITRLLAVFEDVEGIEQIGTIRSSRPYYIDFSQGVDAIYVHIGGSPQAYSQLKADKIDSFDLIEGGNSDMSWRDKARIKNNGYEHSVYTSGERLLNKFSKKGIRMTTDMESVYNFSEDASYEGSDATKISAKFSNYKTGTYTYDEASGLYRIGQYGTTHIDELYNTQLAFKNIFIVQMDSSVIKGDTAGRLVFDSVGSGSGTYFVNGTATEITWRRDSKYAPFKYYTMEGAELPVVPGDSYVAIVPLDAEIIIE